MESEIEKLDAPVPPNSSTIQNGVSTTEKEIVTFEKDDKMSVNNQSREANTLKMQGNLIGKNSSASSHNDGDQGDEGDHRE